MNPPQIERVDINLVDNLNPADLVYDVKGIQIYKNKTATIMIKNLSESPKKFLAIYSESDRNPGWARKVITQRSGATPPKQIVALLEEIKDENNEYCIIVSPEGEIVYQTQGSPDQVRIPKSKLSAIKGMISLHNHPDSSEPSDVDQNFVNVNGLKKSYIIIPEGRIYIIIPNSENIDEGNPAVQESGDDEGTWITINGVHILIKGGESVGDAFKRTTGKSLSGGGKGESSGKTTTTKKKISEPKQTTPKSKSESDNPSEKIRAIYDENKESLKSAERKYLDARQKYLDAGTLLGEGKMGGEEFDRIRLACDQADDTLNEIKMGIREEARDALLSDIKTSNTRIMYSETDKFSVSGSQKETVTRSQNTFDRMVTNESIDRTQIIVAEEKGVRANVSSSVITLGGKDNEAVVIHEMGHVLENHDPSIHEKAVTFLSKRTADQKAVSLRSVTKNDGYADHEITKTDKFLDPYMGKICESGATEIVSMGLQKMYSNPVEFSIKDPEYFNFMLEITGGKK